MRNPAHTGNETARIADFHPTCGLGADPVLVDVHVVLGAVPPDVVAVMTARRWIADDLQGLDLDDSGDAVELRAQSCPLREFLGPALPQEIGIARTRGEADSHENLACRLLADRADERS